MQDENDKAQDARVTILMAEGIIQDASKDYKGHAWCITWFNYEEPKYTFICKLLEPYVRYRVFAEEICPKSGKHHIQGFVYLKESMRRAQLLNLTNQNHIINGQFHKINIWWSRRYSKSTNDQAREYCMGLIKGQPKPGYIRHEEWPGPEARPMQGKRNDLEKKPTIDEKMNQILNGTSNMRLLVEEGTNAVFINKYMKTIDIYESIHNRKTIKPHVTKGTWYYGDTGVGKSSMAFNEEIHPGTRYFKPKDGIWWDNYEGQDIIVIEEYRGVSISEKLTYEDILNITSPIPGYTPSVPRRGKPPIPIMAKELIIISPLPPYMVFEQHIQKTRKPDGTIDALDSLNQLYRRFNVYRVMRAAYTENGDLVDLEYANGKWLLNGVPYTGEWHQHLYQENKRESEGMRPKSPIISENNDVLVFKTNEYSADKNSWLSIHHPSQQ